MLVCPLAAARLVGAFHYALNVYVIYSAEIRKNGGRRFSRAHLNALRGLEFRVPTFGFKKV